MRRQGQPPWLSLLSLVLALLNLLFTNPAQAASNDQKPLHPFELKYKYGDPIPVTCLNRSIETGEHLEDDKGRLQYVPFPTCNETGRPLELYFGVEKGS